jgi:hypothetical protein
MFEGTPTGIPTGKENKNFSSNKEASRAAPKPKAQKNVSFVDESKMQQAGFECLPLELMMKRPPTSYLEIEQNLWKNNIIKGDRVSKNWLDVSNEDFSNYKTIDIFGNEITPSSFNICRDNLAEVDA